MGQLSTLLHALRAVGLDEGVDLIHQVPLLPLLFGESCHQTQFGDQVDLFQLPLPGAVDQHGLVGVPDRHAVFL